MESVSGGTRRCQMSAVASAASISERSTSPVEVRFPDPGKQRRWTVALRLLLLIPLALVAFALAVAAEFLVILGWFAALVLGRLPVGIASFLASVVRYWTRVYAYGLLLLDEYPPFGFKGPYPIAVEIEATRLNRASVLFRLLLAIPAYLLATIVALGMAAAEIVVWLIVLVLGRMPRPLYQASAAAIRYEARYTAYLLLLTSAYPRGLFGDAGLPLSRGAKWIVVVFVVLGLPLWAGVGVLRASQAGSSSSLANTVTADYTRLGTVSLTFGSKARNCSSSAHPFACVQRLIPTLLAATERYDAQLHALQYPAGAQGDAASAEAAASQFVADLRVLEGAHNGSVDLQAGFGSLVRAGNLVDGTSTKLVADLR